MANSTGEENSPNIAEKTKNKRPIQPEKKPVPFNTGGVRINSDWNLNLDQTLQTGHTTCSSV
jgi:hypothetical protein